MIWRSFILRKSGTTSYVWGDDTFIYQLIGKAEKEILIEIIKNIDYEKVKKIF